MDTLSKALEIIRLQANQDPTLLVLTKALEEQPRESRWDLLEMIGMFQSSFDYTMEDFDFLYSLLGPLPDESLAFAESLFDQLIENLSFKKTGIHLKHPLFQTVHSKLSQRVLCRFIAQHNFPKAMDASLVELLIPGNYEHFPIISKNIFISLVNNKYKQETERIVSQGALLAIRIKEIYKSLSHKYSPCLLLIEFTEVQIEFMRKLARCFFNGSIRNEDVNDFIEVWGDGGLLFFSCFICARDLAKETNRDFWFTYYDWLKIQENGIKKYSQSRVNQEIKSFWDNYGINYTSSLSGNNQYVLTFLMHSIVSNRPLSRTLVVRFLLKVIKGTGTIYHDREDQQEILGQQLEEYSKPLKQEIESQNQSNTYLQLPRETALAFCSSAGQVVDFLLPIYDYLERHLIDKVNNGTTSFSAQFGIIPAFIQKEVEEAIRDTSVEEIERLRSVLSVFKKGRATIILNPNNWKLYFSIPQYVFSDLGTYVRKCSNLLIFNKSA